MEVLYVKVWVGQQILIMRYINNKDRIFHKEIYVKCYRIMNGNKNMVIYQNHNMLGILMKILG